MFSLTTLFICDLISLYVQSFSLSCVYSDGCVVTNRRLKDFGYGAQSDAHTGLYSLPLSNLLGDWALDHQPCE